jgi:hypothetical protein
VPRIINGLVSVAFVFAGAKVAPRGQLATALVLAALWIVYSLLIHVVVHLGQGKSHYLDFAIAAAAALLAVALVRYSERAGQRFAEPSSD